MEDAAALVGVVLRYSLRRSEATVERLRLLLIFGDVDEAVEVQLGRGGLKFKKK
jgi:hypothetical protein